MKKRLLALSVAMIMAASALVACTDNAAPTDATEPTDTTVEETTDDGADDGATPDAAVAARDFSGDGTTLNIYCWNDEFQRRVTDHYDLYTKVDDTHGTITDEAGNTIDVVWTIVPNNDNAYQNNLDTALLGQADAADDDKVDLFLVEADYALKYVDSDATMAISDLGIDASEYADQYQYTKDVVTDANGNLKGVSWQGCPAIMFYNRAIATEVLGSDDPETVQAAVKDWDTFNATAADVVAAGYTMTSSVMDTYRVYSNNVTTPWVVDGKINIDANIAAWAEDSKALYDAKATNNYELWGDDWAKGFYGGVFAYFGPAWFINFSMHCDEEGSVGIDGGWGATVGPQGFFWGGTWMCAATGTDNTAVIADMMRQITMNSDVMVEIVKADDDFANNKAAMDEMAASDYTSAILGGQNPLPMYCEGAEKIDLSNLSAYDQGCNEEFQNAMKNYFNGQATYEEALELFYTAVEEKYPELTH